MKKKTLLLMILLIFLTGCKEKIKEPIKSEKKEPVMEEKIEEPITPPYIDDNPIKLSFYLDEGNTWHKYNEYYTTYQAYTDINWFNIFLTEDEYIPITSIKNNWFDAYNKYQNIEKYRIGYEVFFKTKDGQEFYETITSAKNVFSFSFSGYLYMWVYDDVNATEAWYDHLEPEEFTSDTQMSSVKFMATEGTELIDGPINIKVFTFDGEEDFDPDTGRYRGNSSSILQIMSK